MIAAHTRWWLAGLALLVACQNVPTDDRRLTPGDIAGDSTAQRSIGSPRPFVPKGQPRPTDSIPDSIPGSIPDSIPTPIPGDSTFVGGGAAGATLPQLVDTAMPTLSGRELLVPGGEE